MGEHRRRRLAVAAAIAALVAAVVVPIALTGGGPSGRTQTPPAGIPSTELFGASVNRLFNTPTYTDAEIDAQLTALAQTGATVARSDALWEAAEPRAPDGSTHHYDWAFADRIAAALAAHGLRWLPIVDYSAPWAQSVPGQDHSPPTSSSAYAAYAAALAQRYGPGGSFWSAHPGLRAEPVDTYEIWNEPDNSTFWYPRPDAAAYAQLYSAARAAIDAVQPGARVIVGGLTHPDTFLAAMLTANPSLRGTLDGVGIHPYGATPQLVLGAVRTARLALDLLGLASVPLYVTELGWTTSPPGALDYLPEQLRPSYIQQTIAALGHGYCGVAATILYTWVTPERDPADAQDWFGIHPPGGGTSADTDAFTAAIREAQAPGASAGSCAG